MKSLTLATLGFYLAFNLVNAQAGTAPTVTVRNGTYAGAYQQAYNQDFFLGMPFAQPPLGNLRFTRPQPLNTTWNVTRNATQYYPLCVGYGGDDVGYNVSEDCLALNVIRPSGYQGQSLPVGVWIHGGGYVMGGTADRRYNLSFIVQNSVKIGKPIIAVSIAYRLSGWGFLDSTEIRGANITNLGMRDQRLALRWIQENIQAFGGNSSKVTIWGESAGAGSVGIHLIAYGGRDDHLFSGAIAESGASILLGPKRNASLEQAKYNNITAATNCSSANDTLACLRSVSFATLNAALNITPAYTFYPYQDGDLIQGSQAQQLQNGSFIRVPLLIGANSDEGTAFAPRPVDNTTVFAGYLSALGTNSTAVQNLLVAYPDIPAVGIPAVVTTDLGPLFGAQWKRAAAFSGDWNFIAPRRLQCQQWAAYNVSAYCYRFNAPFNAIPVLGATHFVEVAYVFNNLDGLGYALNPFSGNSSLYPLSQLMSNMWAAFIHDGDPNGHGQVAGQPVGTWPAYQNGAGGYGQDFLFDPNVTSHAEPDTFRAAGISYLNTLWSSQYSK